MAMLHSVIRLVRVIYRSQYTVWHGGSQIASMTIHTPPERGVMEYYSRCRRSGFEIPLLPFGIINVSSNHCRVTRQVLEY